MDNRMDLDRGRFGRPGSRGFAASADPLAAKRGKGGPPAKSSSRWAKMDPVSEGKRERKCERVCS